MSAPIFYKNTSFPGVKVLFLRIQYKFSKRKLRKIAYRKNGTAALIYNYREKRLCLVTIRYMYKSKCY